MPNLDLIPPPVHGVPSKPIFRLLVELREAGFSRSLEELPRWLAAAYTNGLYWGHRERSLAQAFQLQDLEPVSAGALFPILEDRLNAAPLEPGNELLQLRAVLQQLVSQYPLATALKTHRLRRGTPSLSGWFGTAVSWGLRASLAGDALFTGRLLALYDCLSPSQKFLTDRLGCILRAGNRRRRPLLVEFFEYTYPNTPQERATLTATAHRVFHELRHQGHPLDEASWIRCGFRDGLSLSTHNPPLCRQLFEEIGSPARQDNWWLFAEHIGPDSTQWQPDRLVREAKRWLGKTHPKTVVPQNRPAEFERLRHLFDFSFWMGLSAGASADR
jgi:hypothetical protein